MTTERRCQQRGEAIAGLDLLLVQPEDLGSESFIEALTCTFVGGEFLNQQKWFKMPTTLEDEQLVTASLLRLLAAHGECYEDRLFSADAMKWLDDHASALYQRAKIRSNDQTFEKQKALRELVIETERGIESVVRARLDSGNLRDYQQKLMQRIGWKTSKEIVAPFLPGLVVERLDELFRLCERYFASRVHDAIERHRLATTVFDELLSGIGACRTRYSAEFLGKPIEALRMLVDENFSKHPATQPAHVTFERTQKKHPFHVAGRTQEVAFIVRNAGPGIAREVELTVREITGVAAENDGRFIGHLDPNSFRRVEIKTVVEKPVGEVLAEIEVKWCDFTPGVKCHRETVEIEAQRQDIQWDELERADPYSLESVATLDELVGRHDTMKRLRALTGGRSVGSAYLYGQKRVGKTSIARALGQVFDATSPSHRSIYLESGDYVAASSEDTVSQLARRICRQVRECDARLRGLSEPDFGAALSPLGEFLDDTQRVAPDLRFLIILDEFDELPVELYVRGELADAFFLTIRSISNKEPFGFLLVGGEKMAFVIDCQGDKLNKFETERIDYFDRDSQWADYQQLVRRPTAEVLEFSESAIGLLHDKTAGNPYFTKLVCKTLYETAVDRRDCHITADEVTAASRTTLEKVSTNAFQHFWEDGIQKGPRAEETSIRRRRILLALADAQAGDRNTTGADVARYARESYGVAEGDATDLIAEFRRRRVLCETPEGLCCAVALFGDWLSQQGRREVMTTFVDIDGFREEIRRDEEAYVKPREIVHLVERWGSYKGERVTEDKVRAWLQQFGDNQKQRLMFGILNGLTFYGGARIREKLREAHRTVLGDLVWTVKEREKKRDDVLVGYVDGAGKSGARYANLYADANRIYHQRVIEKSQLRVPLKYGAEVKAVVFVDDFIGTGSAASEYFEDLATDVRAIMVERGVPLFFVAIAGFAEGKEKLERTLEEMSLPVAVHVCDLLSKADRCFSPESRYFPLTGQREKAHALAAECGARLTGNKRDSLGFGACQAAVVFEDGCPNNCLPILWHDRGDWMPLFRRK